MPPVNDADRHALDTARRHMRLAREALPAGGSRGHMVSLLNSFVASIDDEIGVEEATGETPPADGWHGHEAERQLAIGRIAGEDVPVEADPVLPAWATPSGEPHRRGEC